MMKNKPWDRNGATLTCIIRWSNDDSIINHQTLEVLIGSISVIIIAWLTLPHLINYQMLNYIR